MTSSVGVAAASFGTYNLKNLAELGEQQRPSPLHRGFWPCSRSCRDFPRFARQACACVFFVSQDDCYQFSRTVTSRARHYYYIRALFCFQEVQDQDLVVIECHIPPFVISNSQPARLKRWKKEDCSLAMSSSSTWMLHLSIMAALLFLGISYTMATPPCKPEHCASAQIACPDVFLPFISPVSAGLLAVCQAIYFSVCISVCPPVCRQSVDMSVHLCAYLSVCLSALSLCLSQACVSIRACCLSV